MSITNPNQIPGLIGHYHKDDIDPALKVNGTSIPRWANRANPRLPLRSGYGGYNWPIAVNNNVNQVMQSPTWDSTEGCLKFDSPSNGTGQNMWVNFGDMNPTGVSFFVRLKKRVDKGAISVVAAWCLGINYDWAIISVSGGNAFIRDTTDGDLLSRSAPSASTSAVWGIMQSPGTNQPTYLTINDSKGSPVNRWVKDYRQNFVLGGQYWDPTTLWVTEVVVYNRVLNDTELADLAAYMNSDASVSDPQLSLAQFNAQSWWIAGVGRSSSLWIDSINGKYLQLNSGTYNTPCTSETVNTLPAAGFNNTCMKNTQGDYGWLNTGCATAIITGDLSYSPGAQRNIFGTFTSVGQTISKNGSTFTADSSSDSGQTVSYNSPTGIDIVGMSHGLAGYSAFCNATFNNKSSFTNTVNTSDINLGANPTTGVTNLENMKVVDFILLDYDISTVEYGWLKTFLQSTSRPSANILTPQVQKRSYMNSFIGQETVAPQFESTRKAGSALPVSNGLVRWWDASMGITQSSGNISSWVDRVSSQPMNFDGQTGTIGASTNPQLAIVNSMFSARFAATSAMKSTVGMSTLLSQDYTILVFAQTQYAAGTHQSIFGSGNGWNLDLSYMHLDSRGASAGLYYGQYTQSTVSVLSTLTSARTGCSIIRASGSTAFANYDNTKVTVPYNIKGRDQLWLGYNQHGGDVMDIFHVVVYDRALSDGEISTLVAFFNAL